MATRFVLLHFLRVRGVARKTALRTAPAQRGVNVAQRVIQPRQPQPLFNTRRMFRRVFVAVRPLFARVPVPRALPRVRGSVQS